MQIYFDYDVMNIFELDRKGNEICMEEKFVRLSFIRMMLRTIFESGRKKFRMAASQILINFKGST